MSVVYIIMNESLPIGSAFPITDVVHPGRWTRQAALDDLSSIADQFGMEFDASASNIFVPTEGTHLESDEYYILELEVSD